jgi:cysteine-rich repeat protein
MFLLTFCRAVARDGLRPIRPWVALSLVAIVSANCGGTGGGKLSGDSGVPGANMSDTASAGGAGSPSTGGTIGVTTDSSTGRGGAGGGSVEVGTSTAGTGGTVVDAWMGAGGAGGKSLDGGFSQGGAGGTIVDAPPKQGGVDSGPIDSSGNPSCGDPGTTCCAGNACNGGGCCLSGICVQPGVSCVGVGGGICNAGTCGSCGGAGMPCCGTTSGAGSCTAPGTRCSGSTCTQCGELGVACCAGANGGPGTCNGTNVVCNGSLCVTCGTPGSPCCQGGQCASPSCCDGNLCIAENTSCGTNAGTCQAGYCQTCGHAGEACCPSGGTAGTCQTGTVCSTNGANAVCSRCGGIGDSCCAGNACSQGCCSNGECVAISGCPALPPSCGNGVLDPEETCDDGNTVSGDGCSGDCSAIESGYQCRVPGKRCSPRCGDGIIIGYETCDDGNASSGDGCSSTCQVEPGNDCPTVGKPCTRPVCGNGKLERGELCDCGTDSSKLPAGCKAVNGLFYGDGKGCSKTCTQEPICQDSSGKTQACSTACGDGRLDPGEDCDDGNLVNGDGCSSSCKKEDGFVCSIVTTQDSTTCQSGSGQCLDLPITFRDFQPENATTGGHPDFFFLGTKYNGSKSPTTICVPDAAGPSKGNDSTKRCWGIVGSTLLKGKPQAGTTTTCECQFGDWSIGNTSHIPGGYTQAANDSPLSDGFGAYQGGIAGSAVTTTSTAGVFTGTITGYTTTSPGGPIFKGTVPAYKDTNSFNQWFNDDATVNKTFTGTLELASIGTNIYQYASRSHLAQGGFFPLDVLNPNQATLCNLYPYWNHGSGNPIWTTCTGDQYLFPPRVIQSDCPNQNPLSNGCWVTNVPGIKHDSYFTDETRYDFVYDGASGLQLSFYGDDDLFVFINGILVLDLGGIHQQLPGKVRVTGDPGDAQVTEGGCLDTAGNIAGATAGSNACSPSNVTAPTAATPDDFRVRTVSLGLTTGKVYEIAIFGADRHPPESNFQLTLNGSYSKRSMCAPRCGDGVATGGEECDCGDGSGITPDGCPGPNSDTTYGGCTTQCKLGPYCGDGVKNGPEQCDLGRTNGDTNLGADGCSIGCTKPRYCGDGIVDAALGEQCDLGTNNGLPGYACDSSCQQVR